MDNEMQDIVNTLLDEFREHLATIEADLLAIEDAGEKADRELINKVFRAAHSIKGGAGFCGLTNIKTLAHKAETVLDMLRSGKMLPNPEIVNVLLAAFDQLREMINHPAESETVDLQELLTNLTGLASSYLPLAQKATLTQMVTVQPGEGVPAVDLPQVDMERVRRCGERLYSLEYDLIHDIERQGKNVLEVFRALWTKGEILDCAIDYAAVGTLDDPVGNRLPLRLIFATAAPLEELSAAWPARQECVRLMHAPETKAAAEAPAIPPEAAPVPAPTPAAAPTPTPAPKPAAAPTRAPEPATAEAPAPAATPGSTQSAPAEETVRVNVSILEQLVNLAGELVLGRNQLRAAIARKNARALATADQRINQITSELQEVIMQTRLQPIGNVFAKFPRVVRDLSAALEKEIHLEIRGKEVALDKALVEGLSDPLTHMVRNAVDHGIELPEKREHAGKKRCGVITIEARHEAGQVVVEIIDDGGGIDPERIARSALEKGLISVERLATMSATDKTSLLFLPGLSTAKEVSEVSGRGVGMDVVKTNLDRLGGKIEILSELGHGTTFRIKLPLTLAIIPSLIFSVTGERFAIPQINVEELLRILPAAQKSRIEVVGDTEVLVLRDQLIPLVRFSEILGTMPAYTDKKAGTREVDRRSRLADRRSPHHPAAEAAPGPEEFAPARSGQERRKAAASALEIAVVTTGTLTYGLVVGEFHDTEEIVVKPLGRHLKSLEEYSGATILGDGAVALILDVAGLAAKAGLGTVSTSARAGTGEEAQEELADRQAMLLFHNAPDELCAMYLDTVLRVEHIRLENVENIGGRRTMQYRGNSLPLVTLADTAQVKAIGNAQDLAVVVSSIRGHEVGLLGAMPVDVIETHAIIDQTTHRQKGIAGSTIIDQRTTLIADLLEVVDATWPEWGADEAAHHAATVPGDQVILLAEDSDFFRAQIQRFIEDDGYTVLAAPDGEAAWELLTRNLDQVRLVVTDIEMPRLNGLGLARRIRADQRTAALPIIAVTSLADDEHMAQGQAAGINDYQVKLDRDRLLESLRKFLHHQNRDAATASPSQAGSEELRSG
jgi:two-component system chemotaxis sensor kinase CheA